MIFYPFSLSVILFVHTWQVESRIDETGCPVEFQKRCVCMMTKYVDLDTKKRFTVNCTDSGFRDVSMLAHLSEQTEVLIFRGNFISELPINIFGTNDSVFYDDLEIMDLSNNNIKFIHGKTFHKVSSVKTLILNHNDIEISGTKLKPRVFSNFDSIETLHLTNAFTESINASDYLLNLEDIFWMSDVSTLKKLHLEQNEIWTIGSNTSIFCQIYGLQHLYLGNNRLRDLDFKLECMSELLYVDLQMNNINRLSSNAMEILNKVPASRNLKINLLNNPFICDCQSSDFIKWMQRSQDKLYYGERYTCYDGFPKENIGKFLVDVHTLECPAAPAGYSSSTVGSLTFFMVFFMALALSFMYYHRSKLKNIAEPYWDFLTRKIGYSGIANEEVVQEVSV